jgi:hypothetical protein
MVQANKSSLNINTIKIIRAQWNRVPDFGEEMQYVEIELDPHKKLSLPRQEAYDDGHQYPDGNHLWDGSEQQSGLFGQL